MIIFDCLNNELASGSDTLNKNPQLLCFWLIVCLSGLLMTTPFPKRVSDNLSHQLGVRGQWEVIRSILDQQSDPKG